MHRERLTRARQVARDAGVEALLVGPSADLRYLTGYDALALERLTLLVVPVEGDGWLLVPELEAPRAQASGADRVVEIVPWGETQDPVSIVASRLSAGKAFAVGDRLWTMFTLALQAALPSARWLPGSVVMRELRLIKSPDEIRALAEVAGAIDRVHASVSEILRPGRSEAEAGRDIAELILETHDTVNFVIVASGPNGASPHHDTGRRRLADADAVVVDIGGTLDGYCSDSTRNYVIGSPPPGYAQVHAVVEAAREAAIDTIRPGATAGEVDLAARSVIADAGFGDAFIHRTGHGIGIEEHEEPWIVAGSGQPLETGMVFSVEPGIYLQGRYGARIEDIVAVADSDASVLNRRPRSFTVCDS